MALLTCSVVMSLSYESCEVLKFLWNHLVMSQTFSEVITCILKVFTLQHPWESSGK